MRIPFVDLKTQYQSIKNEIDSLFRIVAGILHFGNISFTPKADRRDDACEIDAKTKTWVGSTSKLLQIDEEEFTIVIVDRPRRNVLLCMLRWYVASATATALLWWIRRALTRGLD